MNFHLNPPSNPGVPIAPRHFAPTAEQYTNFENSEQRSQSRDFTDQRSLSGVEVKPKGKGWLVVLFTLLALLAGFLLGYMYKSYMAKVRKGIIEPMARKAKEVFQKPSETEKDILTQHKEFREISMADMLPIPVGHYEPTEEEQQPVIDQSESEAPIFSILNGNKYGDDED